MSQQLVYILIRTSFISSDFDGRFAHTQTLQHHYLFLVDNLDAKHSELLGELYQAGVLSREELDIITAEVTSFSQNEKFLSMLSRKSMEQFDKFLDALDKTGQHHVRNYITRQQGQPITNNVFSP